MAIAPAALRIGTVSIAEVYEQAEALQVSASVAPKQPMTLRVEMRGWRECAPGLADDLARFFPERRGAVSLELALHPTEHPFLPPFVRVVAPQFEPRTGFVLRGGAIALDIYGAWTAATTLPCLLESLRAGIASGAPRLLAMGGRLPEAYDERTARASFLLAAKAHGWRV